MTSSNWYVHFLSCISCVYHVIGFQSLKVACCELVPFQNSRGTKSQIKNAPSCRLGIGFRLHNHSHAVDPDVALWKLDLHDVSDRLVHAMDVQEYLLSSSVACTSIDFSASTRHRLNQLCLGPVLARVLQSPVDPKNPKRKMSE